MKQQIQKSFQKSIAALILFFIALTFILLQLNASTNLTILLIGLPLLSAGLFGICGVVDAIGGRREPNSWRKVMAYIINFAIVIVLLALIIANIGDIVKLFS